MKQNHYSRKRRQLKVLAEKLDHLYTYHKEDASTQIKKLVQKIKKLVQELVHVFSSADLKKILGAAAILIGISFTNQTSAQSFAAPVLNPFGLTSTRSYAIPAFADLDGDGDFDLLVGAYEGSMKYFENTGSATDPNFAAPQLNPYGLDSTNYIALPAFADLDDDGDTDLLVGEYYGAMQYFENTGSATNPQFAAAQPNPFGLTSAINHAAPAFADLDNDGDFDLLVGEYYGKMKYFENTGTATNPQFAPPVGNPFGLIPMYEIAFPAFADLDGDSDLDLLVGEYYGNMSYFENIGSPDNPQFATPQMNPFGIIPTYYLAIPTFADLDGDGDIDLLVGEYYGNMKYFENTTIVGIASLDKDFEVKVFPNPFVNEVQIKSGRNIESIEVFGISGKVVASYEDETSVINLSHLKTGIYFLKITDLNGEYATQRIQKH